MGKETSEIWLFVCSIYGVTWALWSGGVVTVALGIYKWRCKKDLAWTWLVIAIAATIVLASFLAWQDLYHQTQTQQARIGSLAKERDAKEGDAEIWRAKAEVRQDQINRLTAEQSRRSPAPEGSIAVLSWSEEIVPAPENAEPFSHATKVTIWSDRELIRPDIELKADSPISFVTFPEDAQEGVGYIGEPKGTVWEFILEPKIARTHRWSALLCGKQPIRVLYVHQPGGATQ